MRDALVAVSPSALESFSLVVIEAWVDRVPVLVNGACGPTREHCERSGGGLWFTSYPEFEAVLRPARGRRPAPGARWGRGDATYVDRHFRWPVLIERYAAVPHLGGGARPGSTEHLVSFARASPGPVGGSESVDAHHGPVEVLAAHGATERGVAVGEHAAVGGHEPVALPVGGRLHGDDRPDERNTPG